MGEGRELTGIEPRSMWVCGWITIEPLWLIHTNKLLLNPLSLDCIHSEASHCEPNGFYFPMSTLVSGELLFFTEDSAFDQNIHTIYIIHPEEKSFMRKMQSNLLISKSCKDIFEHWTFPEQHWIVQTSKVLWRGDGIECDTEFRYFSRCLPVEAVGLSVGWWWCCGWKKLSPRGHVCIRLALLWILC